MRFRFFGSAESREKGKLMTATVQRRRAGVRRERGQSGESSPAVLGVPAPPKARRRWGLLAAMVALVCVGALGNVWLLGSISDSSPVLVATSPIERGAVVRPSVMP